MVLSKEEYQDYLTELLDADETPNRARLTEIATNLRDAYYETHDEHESLSDSVNKLQEENYEISITNSQLFRQVSNERQGRTEEQEEQLQEETFSETISIEDMEKGVGA